MFSEELDGSVSGRRMVSEMDHNIMNNRREKKRKGAGLAQGDRLEQGGKL